MQGAFSDYMSNGLSEAGLQLVGQGNHFLDAVFRQIAFLELSEYFGQAHFHFIQESVFESTDVLNGHFTEQTVGTEVDDSYLFFPRRTG